MLGAFVLSAQGSIESVFIIAEALHQVLPRLGTSASRSQRKTEKSESKRDSKEKDGQRWQLSNQTWLNGLFWLPLFLDWEGIDVGTRVLLFGLVCGG
jgi:hypothetical protein